MRFATERRPATGGWLDRFIGWVSPAAGARREAWHAIRREVASYYRDAGRSRLAAGTPGINVSADELNYLEREGLVDRNREAERNYPSYQGVMEQAVINIVGPEGFALQAKTDDAGFNVEAEAAWKEWCAGPCDIRRMATMVDLQEGWVRGYLRDGDIGAILWRSGEVETVEEHRIRSPEGMAYDGGMVDGVELRRRGGRPLAFHVTESDDFVGSARTVRVPARDFAFLPLRKRLSQTRGIPALTNLRLFEQYGDYIEATVVAARVAACFGVVLKRKGGALPPALTSSRKDSQGNARKTMTLEPGMWKAIDTDEEIEQIKPQHPGTGFGELRSAIKRDIGGPLGMPLELTDLDFSKTNYSSARASLLAAYRTFMRHQVRLGQFLSRIYRWRVSKWVKEGDLRGAPEGAYWGHIWQAPRWPWVDPLKEIQANLLAMDAGVETLADVCASRGRDWMDQLDVAARVRARREELNLPDVRSSMSRDAGGEPSDSPTTEDDDE